MGSVGTGKGTLGSVPTIFGMLPNVVEQRGVSSRTIWEYWHNATVDGKQGCPQAIAHSDCAIYSNKLRYLLFQSYCRNIPILPEAFLTFASKSLVGPSLTANGQ